MYCLLSQGRREEIEKNYNCSLKIAVNHLANKEFLGMNPKENGISPELIWGKKDQLMQRYHEITQNGDKSGSIPTDLSNIIDRIRKLSEIESGDDWKILTDNHSWVSYSSVKNSSFKNSPNSPTSSSLSNFSNPSYTSWENLALSSSSFLTIEESKSVSNETLYEKTKPFSWGILISLVGILFSILSIQNEKFKAFAMGSLILLFLTDVYGITLRVLISGRAPVTNMYETVMWSGFCLFIIASIVGFYLKNRKVWAFGFFGNALCLLMMNFAPGMLDGTIQPLVPVLRDNFWLSTHVTSITLSYSCFALSWLIGNFVLLVWLFKKSSTDKWIDDWNYVIRISMQVGSVFLALGIILGGVWADYSWGRFWGWDPKETWSLIALIVYMALLHGRYVGWFKGIYFTMMAGLGFMFVLMAWFGVNYILAVGLHSYGFSSGGALFLATVFLAQTMILGISFVKKKLSVVKI